jgi:membrane-associated protease RseP (regulator of RpoE activity)
VVGRRKSPHPGRQQVSRALDLAHAILIPLRRYALHLALFLATCFTTFLAGGAVFAATLMTILLTHEMGHFVTARRYGIDASLPYFIPLPFLGLGTLGAVIKMSKPIDRRDALFDVGASGPLCGLAVAVPLLAIGLSHSPIMPQGDNALLEGGSILYIAVKLAVLGRYVPADGIDVELSPMAMASWVGILLTFINLIPLGQLDGGHIAYALFGPAWNRIARWLHRGLLLMGASVFTYLAIEAAQAGHGVLEVFLFGIQGGLPWLVWAGIILLMRRMGGGVYHPPVGPEPLSPNRRRLGIVMACVFVMVFTPVPFRMLP